MISRQSSNQKGASLVEMPVALSIFIIFLLFPLIDLATIALRSATAYYAAYNAAHSAARAPTFLADDPATGKPSACEEAIRAAQATKAAALAGTNFEDGDIKARILALPLNSDPTKPRKADFIGADNKPLPPDPGVDQDYIYQVEVSIDASIEPLFTLSTIFGQVPGLTIAIPLKVTSRQNVENPDGWVR
ncbi:MAG: hypothetical protein K2X27_13875 [Candidatus Obscuribacterales bacterium]|nr:hypothetical protein [Candidatus Obscuribacterales bacterium]